MKRKVAIAVVSILCTLICAVALTACGSRGGGEKPAGPGDDTPAGPVTPSEYTVVYDANGGRFDTSAEIEDGMTVSSDGAKCTLTTKLTTLMPPLRAVERTQYVFAGWAKDKDGQTPWNFESDTLSDDLTLYAVWAVTFDYALSEDESHYIVRGIGGLSGDVEIPETYNDKPVRSIAENAFKNSRSLTGIVIADSVTEIGNGAFANAIKLESVKVGEGVTRLPEQVFKDCKALAVLCLPKSLKEISLFAFGDEGLDSLLEVRFAGTADDWCGMDMECSDTYGYANPLANGKAELYIDDKVAEDITLNAETVRRHAFYKYAALKSVHIGSGVKTIEEQAFRLSGATALTFAEDAAVTSIGKEAFQASDIESLEFPSSLVRLGEKAFYDSRKLASLKLGGVKYVGDSAFADCWALTSVDLGQAEELGDSAFSSYEPEARLTSVTIPDTVWHMGSSCFSFQSKLSSVTFARLSRWYVTTVGMSQSTETLTADALSDTSKNAERLRKSGSEWVRCYGTVTYELNYEKTEAYVAGVTDRVSGIEGVLIIEKTYNGKPVTSIGHKAFQNCNGLRSIMIPNSVTSIGDSVFRGCGNLTGITIPNSVTYIGAYAFQNCNLVSLTLPDSVKEVGACAFQNCGSLTSVTLPDRVTCIGSYTFCMCVNLANITIPDSVTSIGEYAFAGCVNLTSITIPDGVTSIGGSAFSGCRSFASITIPDSVTSIGRGAFSGCSSLTYEKYGGAIYLGNSTNPHMGLVDVSATATSCTVHKDTKVICDGAFSDRGWLTSITVDEGSTQYSSQDGILYNKAKTQIEYVPEAIKGEITIPDSMTSIGENAFYKRKNLTSIKIPESVESIGRYAFSACDSLTSITIPNSVTSIGDSAFSSCDSLTSITFPTGLTSIADKTFSYCRGLTSITIPDGVTSIGSDVFFECTKLKSIAIPDSVTSIGNRAFSGCGSLTSITIPDGVTYIGQNAFEKCYKLTSITIPDSVTRIVLGAFTDCTKITTVFYTGDINAWRDMTIDRDNTNLTDATWYFYSKSAPTSQGDYWHYVDGEPTIWRN